MNHFEKKIIFAVAIAGILLAGYGVLDRLMTQSPQYHNLGPAAAWRASLGVPNFDFTKQGQAQRLQHSFVNFLTNASFEYFFDGENTAPNGWLAYQSRVKKSTDASVGDYSAEVIFNSKDSQIIQSFTAAPYVKYTYSIYYKRVAGSGTANLVAQEDGGNYTEYASVGLGDKSTGWHLATLTFIKPDDGTNQVRFKIGQTSDTVINTIWRLDEAMAQEGVGLASAFVNNVVDDSTVNQSIYGSKNFYSSVNLAARYGNVGVGTLATDPSVLLHVAGDSLFNGDIKLANPGKGIGLTSPNGSLFCLTVSDSGGLVVSAGECQ